MKNILFYFIILLASTMSLSAAIDINIADLKDIQTDDENFTLWAALFGLGAVGLIALFLSSEQLSNFKKKSEKVTQTKDNMTQKQDQILSSMGENIQNIAKENAQTAKKLADDKNISAETDINSELVNVVNSEAKLLAIATNLIEFLRIKSKKVEIANEKFKLSNLLNDVSGTLKSNTKNSKLELIYNIKSNIPDNLTGDTLNLSKVLVNILIYCVEKNASEIVLKVSKNSIFNKDENLFFTISTNVKIDAENSDNIFNSNYNEDTGNYDSLGLFIAKELSTLMGGELIARNDKDKNIEFVFDIAFVQDKEPQAETTIESKKVLIVDSSYNSALAIKEIFSELKHKVTLKAKENYLLKMPDFSKFDIIVLDEKLFTKKALNAIKLSEASIISLSNLYDKEQEFPNANIAKIKLNKPLTKKQLSETLEQIYIQKPIKSTKEVETKTTDEQSLIIHKSTFADAKDINLNRFSEFRGTKVLLVEDNLINQKVLVGMLGKSGMDISVANNGQEALDMLDKGEKFDIVFMDINMPVMDGYAAAQGIREEEKFNQLPIVALSALTSLSEIDAMFNSGMNGYLSKPLKKEKLFTVFTMFVDEKKKDRRDEIREDKKSVSLDGLNIEIGIAQSSSSDIFYKEILSEFKDAYGDSGKVFDKLVSDFRYEQLRMLCIDIKGLSGSIGAEDLHTLTTEILQRLLFKKYEIIPTYIEQYNQELNRINKSIDEYIT